MTVKYSLHYMSTRHIHIYKKKKMQIVTSQLCREKILVKCLTSLISMFSFLNSSTGSAHFLLRPLLWPKVELELSPQVYT